MTKYVLDLNKIMDWVSNLPKSERSVITTITQTYPIVENTYDEEKVDVTVSEIPQKEISETKSETNETMSNIRWDLMKTLLFTLLQNENIVTEGDLSFSDQIIFNTLTMKGFIKIIED
jgi:hypothetical protein